MPKIISLRKCVISNERLPKNELIRIVKTKDGEIIIDKTGKVNGHGVYLKKDKQVIDKAKKSRKLDFLLATKVNEEIYQQLNDII